MASNTQKCSTCGKRVRRTANMCPTCYPTPPLAMADLRGLEPEEQMRRLLNVAALKREGR